MKTKSIFIILSMLLIFSCTNNTLMENVQEGAFKISDINSSMDNKLLSDYFIYVNGKKHYYQISTGKILLQSFESNIDSDKTRNSLQAMSVNARKVTQVQNNIFIVELEETSKDEITNLVKQLNVIEKKLKASLVLYGEDGAEMSFINQILVRLKQESDYPLLWQYLQLYNMKGTELCEFDSKTYLVTLDDIESENSLQIANELYETGLFEYAEPNLIHFVEHFTNDEYYNLQWALHSSTAGIQADSAWLLTSGGSSNIKIAIIDTGVDLSHPDLTNNLLQGYNPVSNILNGGVVNNNTHGTACAGIVAAVANNNIGIAGIAYNCKILPIYQGDTSSEVAAAINWARSNGADVISMSLGCTETNAINTAISTAISTGRNNKGCVIVAAAGNKGASTVSYPASRSDVISVGASTSLATKMVDSNYGANLDVVAPGYQIYSTDIQGGFGYNTSNGIAGNYYDNFGGTSFACPHVAGVAALLLSVNPNLTQTQVRYAIESSCSKINPLLYPYTYNSNHPNSTWHSNVGHGLVNAFGALTSLIPVINPVSGLTCSSHTVSLSSSVPSFVTQIVWSCSSALNIVSGQGTSSVSINKNPYTSEQGAYLHANFQISGGGVVSKWIWVFFEPTSVLFIDSNEESTNAGGSITFNAGPTGAGTYEWRVTPSNGTQLSSYTHYCNVSFQYSGYYDIECRLITNCGTSEWKTVQVRVY